MNPIDLRAGDVVDAATAVFKETLAEELLTNSEVDHYPTPGGSAQLKDALSEAYCSRHDVVIGHDQSLITNGARSALFASTYASGRTAPVGFADPAYFAIPMAVQQARRSCWPVPLGDLIAGPDDLSRAFAALVGGSFILNNPHNPTGYTFNQDQLQAIAAAAAKYDVQLIGDAVYAEIYSPCQPPPTSILSVTGKALEIISWSKMSRAPGWRLGAIIGDATQLDRIRSFVTSVDNGVPLAVQIAGARALGDVVGLSDWRLEVFRRRQAFELGLRQLGFILPTPTAEAATNFVWAEVPGRVGSGASLAKLLDRHDVYVLPGDVFGSSAGRFVRFALNCDVIGLNEALRRIAAALAEADHLAA